ncbi:hypothetical protein Tco_0535488 [Tanacetum coccineum]
MVTDHPSFPPPANSTVMPHLGRKLDSEFNDEENSSKWAILKLKSSSVKATYYQPQALTTTNMFQANHEDAYDSDVDEGPNAVVAFMANLSSTSAANSQVNEVYSNDNPMFDNVDYQLSQEMHQDERLDSDAETEIDDNTIPYHQYLLDTEAQNVPTETGTSPSDFSETSVNADYSRKRCSNPTLSEKKEINCIFNNHKKEKIFSEKKDLADSYLDEIVCLKNANKVARDMLQRFNMPTQTIPMLSKKPKAATADLHKDLLGTRNPGLGYMAKRAQPALYDADTLLRPTHHPVSIWDSEEVLVHQVVSMKKMNEKPGHVRPANGFYEKLNALMFVPQQELSREQAYWLPANERASQTSNPNRPVTPYVHKSRPPSQVLASLRNVNAAFPQFEGVKPTSGASKTVPKRAPRNHSSLPVKSANARRVEAHHRTLNKKNRVDSNLLVKHSVSVSNLNNVCGACNKSLVFANHTDCLVMCDGSVNVKPHQTKRFKRQPKKEWKPIKRVWKPISKPVANSKPQWKPTGRHFSLFEKYPLTRIMESTDMPIELPPSASSSPQITMVSRFTDHKLSDRKAGSKGISGILEY